MKPEYDIFISYRREGAGETAYIIYQQLEKSGYRVFFDLEQMKGGLKFNIQLLDKIAQCRDFILVLPPGGLDRCQQEDDWVRREIEQALRCNKPVIPVMLRDFSWPDNLPPSIREVAEYQAVLARDFETFPEIMERLKTYLSSSPRRHTPFRRLLPALAAGLVLLLAGLGVMIWEQDVPGQAAESPAFRIVCAREANAAAQSINVLHQTLGMSDAMLERWKQFCADYAAAAPAARKELIKQTRQFLNHQSEQLETAAASVPAWNLTGEDRQTLAAGQIPLADLESFHQSIYPSMLRDFRSMVSTQEQYLSAENVGSQSIRHLEFIHDIYQSETLSLYYQYLLLLADMPPEARQDNRAMASRWTMFPAASPFDHPEKLKDLAEQEQNRAESLVRQFELYVARLEEQSRASLSSPQLQKDIRQFIQDRSRESLTRLKAQEAELNEMRAQFLETDQKLTASYERAAKKFAIHPGDDADLMWGKVLRMVTLAENSRLQRMEAAARNKELAAIAREQGINTSFLTTLPYTVTVEEMFRNVQIWLNDCEHNSPASPGSRARFNAARHFYQAVSKGEIPLTGIQVIGFKDGKPHPVYQVGDIVTRRNGQPISSVEEYQALKPSGGKDEVTILRYAEDGRKSTLTAELPGNAVLTGFLPMRENPL